MSILNYGLFWRREEVEWCPGMGYDFRLIGRRGRGQNLRLANVREQSGVYILYGNYGVFRVGIVTTERLGVRLREHNNNYTQGEWDRFSWFGFQKVRTKTDSSRFCILGAMPQVRIGRPDVWIRDIESLLIRAMGPTGQNEMNFTNEEHCEQVGEDEIPNYQRLVEGLR